VEAMAARGFTAVNPETHTVDEQARIAGAAEIVAGPYGANLANVLFAAHARKAFVIGTKGVPDFARLLSACRVPAWHTVARPVKIREGRTFSESHGFAVDLEELRLGLAAMLDGAS
jgi:capsular polysaccharide biosynthesis protein